MKHVLVGLCLMLLGSNAAFSLDLHQAKAGGLVGERNDGYVGYVVCPPSNEVKAYSCLVLPLADDRCHRLLAVARHRPE